MDRIDGQPVYSATDLVAFLACEHLTQLERAALAGLTKRPMREDPELDVIRRARVPARGAIPGVARSRGQDRVDDRSSMDRSADRGADLRAAAAQTIEAMAAGAEVIYQATFFDGTFRGHADFLLRVERPTARPLGSVALRGCRHEARPSRQGERGPPDLLVRDQLERLQGVRPEWMHVALGGSARTVERLRVDDFMAYYRSARDRFLATIADRTPPEFPPLGTYPEPVEHCDVCRWAAECVARRRADDHLSLVAGISARQRRALTQRGVATLESLGDLACR